MAIAFASHATTGRGNRPSGTALCRALGKSALCLGLSLLLLGCARPPNLVDIPTVVPVESVPEATTHRVFIATSRAPSDDPAELFSGARGATMSFASVDVSVPPNRATGTLQTPSRPPADPRKHFVINDPEKYPAREDFRNDLSSYLRALPKDKRDVLIYVHGYNTNTTSAILQVAQFVEDTGYHGVPLLFTWASSANTLKYVYDVNSALVARDDLVSMLDTIELSAVEGYDIVAHSMGTFLVMEASRQVMMTTGLNASGKVRNVILAAPDIDVDLFKKQIELIPEDQRNIVVLVSNDDKALRASQRVAGGVSRVGLSQVEQLTELGVLAIDLSEADEPGTLSHSKFKNSPEVVQIIGNSINSNESFSTGPRLGLGQALAVTVEGTVRAITPGRQ